MKLAHQPSASAQPNLPQPALGQHRGVVTNAAGSLGNQYTALFFESCHVPEELQSYFVKT